MLIACDGIWDVLSSQQACDHVNKRLNAMLKAGEQIKPSIILAELFDTILSPDIRSTHPGTDNMSAVLVVFKKTQEVRRGSAFKDMVKSLFSH